MFTGVLSLFFKCLAVFLAVALFAYFGKWIATIAFVTIVVGGLGLFFKPEATTRKLKQVLENIRSIYS